MTVSTSQQALRESGYDELLGYSNAFDNIDPWAQSAILDRIQIRRAIRIMFDRKRSSEVVDVEHERAVKAFFAAAATANPARYAEVVAKHRVLSPNELAVRRGHELQNGQAFTT